MHYEQFADGTVKCIENEIPFDIPDSWAWCRITVVSLEIFAGGDKPDDFSKERTINHCVPIYSNGIENNGLYGYTNKARVSSPSLTISARGTIGYCCIRNEPFFPIVRLITIVPVGIDLLYLKFVFETLIETGEGSSIPQLTVPSIKPKLIPVPPLNEQVKIASMVNNLFNILSKLGSNKKELVTVITSIKSKILDLAICGKLVPQDPNDEPASVLLERIRAEKEELIKQGKIKRDKKESVIFKGEDNSYYIQTGSLIEELGDWSLNCLPDSWGICCLGEVCDYGSCVNVGTDCIEDDAWILDLEDIEKDTGRVIKKVKKSERSAMSTKHSFKKGQVLYSKLRPYLNKVVLADEDGYCTSEILPLDFNLLVLPAYARYYLMTPAFLAYANRCSYGVKMPRLSTSDGKKAVMTIPPLAEQKRIVAAIETYYSKLDKIAEMLT